MSSEDRSGDISRTAGVRLRIVCVCPCGGEAVDGLSVCDEVVLMARTASESMVVKVSVVKRWKNLSSIARGGQRKSSQSHSSLAYTGILATEPLPQDLQSICLGLLETSGMTEPTATFLGTAASVITIAATMFINEKHHFRKDPLMDHPGKRAKGKDYWEQDAESGRYFHEH